MFPISHFNITRTPFYYYDKTLLSNTLAKLIRLAGERNYRISCKKNCICRGWKGRLGNRICP